MKKTAYAILVALIGAPPAFAQSEDKPAATAEEMAEPEADKTGDEVSTDGEAAADDAADMDAGADDAMVDEPKLR